MTTVSELVSKYGLEALSDIKPSRDDIGRWQIEFSQGPNRAPVFMSVDRAKWFASDLRNLGDSDDAWIITQAVLEAEKLIKADNRLPKKTG